MSDSQKNRAIFLDRDGTINVDKGYIYKEQDFVFLPGVIDALRVLYDKGFLLIIVTNQSGIGRGYYTEKDFEKLNAWMLDKLENQGVHIAKVYYCPHLPDAPLDEYRKDCECRKPKLGMYYQAITDYNIDLGNSFAIGDKIRDCVIAELTDCKGILIGTNENQDIINEVKAGKHSNVEYAKDLLEASKIIVEST